MLPPAGRILLWRHWRSRTSLLPLSAAWLAWPAVFSVEADIIPKVPRTSCPCLWEHYLVLTLMTSANAWWVNCEINMNNGVHETTDEIKHPKYDNFNSLLLLTQMWIYSYLSWSSFFFFLDHVPVHCYFHYSSAFSWLFISPPWEEWLDRGKALKYYIKTPITEFLHYYSFCLILMSFAFFRWRESCVRLQLSSKTLFCSLWTGESFSRACFSIKQCIAVSYALFYVSVGVLHWLTAALWSRRARRQRQRKWLI